MNQEVIQEWREGGVPEVILEKIEKGQKFSFTCSKCGRDYPFSLVTWHLDKCPSCGEDALKMNTPAS